MPAGKSAGKNMSARSVASLCGTTEATVNQPFSAAGAADIRAAELIHCRTPHTWWVHLSSVGADHINGGLLH
jgi:hypothetical protein